MHVDYLGFIAPAALGALALFRAARGQQPKGSLLVALLMGIAVAFVLRGEKTTAMLIEVVGVAMAVILIVGDRSWRSRNASPPFAVKRFLRRLGCLVAIAGVLGVGINADSEAIRLMSWSAVVVVCVGLLRLGWMDGRSRDGR